MCKAVCKDCNVELVKQRKRILETGRIYYADEQGRRWNGRSCPDCFHEYVAGRKKGSVHHYKKRSKPSDEFGEPSAKLRACKACGTMSTNYFKCPPCTTSFAYNNPDFFSGAYEEEMFGSPVSTPSFRAGFQY